MKEAAGRDSHPAQAIAILGLPGTSRGEHGGLRMRNLAPLAVALVLPACATMQTGMGKIVHKDIQEAIERLGAPYSKQDSGAGNIYTWRSSGQHWSPIFTPLGLFFLGGGVSCTLKIRTNPDDRIAGASWDGSNAGCDPFVKALNTPASKPPTSSQPSSL